MTTSKDLAWKEPHPGLFETSALGFDYVVNVDGSFTIHFGSDKNRTVILSNCKSVSEMKAVCQANHEALYEAVLKAVEAAYSKGFQECVKQTPGMVLPPAPESEGKYS